VRTFEDASGARWDVVTGRESYGTMVLLFSRRDVAGGVLRLMLASETPFEADDELQRLTDEELRERLERASPWR
jgi:hypothetical protein